MAFVFVVRAFGSALDRGLASCPQWYIVFSMENRYYYLDRDGQVQGPVWLSVMRELWKNGRLMPTTEVSFNGADGWQGVEFHPEIFEVEVRLPVFKRIARAKSDPVRLLIWTVLLFFAYSAWVIVHWNDGKRLRLPSEDPPATAIR